MIASMPLADDINLATLEADYVHYVDTFRSSDGTLPPMMELKRVHTAHVLANAKLIADGEHFDASTRRLALAAALLHDTGRYEQLKRYNTFRDSDSVDHAVFSHDIVQSKGWLERGTFTAEERETILAAILYHNRRDVPPHLDPRTESVAYTCLLYTSPSPRDS